MHPPVDSSDQSHIGSMLQTAADPAFQLGSVNVYSLVQSTLEKSQTYTLLLSSEELQPMRSLRQDYINYMINRDSLMVPTPPFDFKKIFQEDYDPLQEHFSKNRKLHAQQVAEHFTSGAGDVFASASNFVNFILRDRHVLLTGDKIPSPKVRSETRLPEALQCVKTILAAMRDTSLTQLALLDKKLAAASTGDSIEPCMEALQEYSRMADSALLHSLELAEYLSSLQDIILIAVEELKAKNGFCLADVIYDTFVKYTYNANRERILETYVDALCKVRHSLFAYKGYSLREVYFTKEWGYRELLKKIFGNILDAYVDRESVQLVEHSSMFLPKCQNLKELAESVNKSTECLYANFRTDFGELDVTIQRTMVLNDAETAKYCTISSIALDSMRQAEALCAKIDGTKPDLLGGQRKADQTIDQLIYCWSGDKPY